MHSWPYSCHGQLVGAGAGEAATRVATKATATKRVDLKNCIVEEWKSEDEVESWMRCVGLLDTFY